MNDCRNFRPSWSATDVTNANVECAFTASAPPTEGCWCQVCQAYALGFAAGRLADALEREDADFVAAVGKQALSQRTEEDRFNVS